MPKNLAYISLLSLLLFAPPSFAEGFDSADGKNLEIGIGGETILTLNPNQNLYIKNGMKVRGSDAACDKDHIDLLRFNSQTKKMELCNGTSWIAQ